MLRLLILLLLLPFAGLAQTDTTIYPQVRFGSGGVIIVDPVKAPKPVPVYIRDTVRIVKDSLIYVPVPVYIDTTIYRDTCLSKPPVVVPPVDPPAGNAGTAVFAITPKTVQYPFLKPFGGLEQWNDQNYVASNVRKLDKYFRFSWSMFETGKDQYTWTKFDKEMNDAIDKGQKFSFGIMTHYPDAVSPHRLNYDGGYSVYPEYLHKLMQAESVKDWKASNGAWVPNWNSDAYITRLLALHQAINKHLYETVYKGVRYSDNINYIDIRGYGAFGEWHSYTIANQMSQYPTGTRATEASLKRIVDAHTKGFPNFPLVALVAAFDANRLGNTMNPPGIAHYILTTSNDWGKIGWRRDNWGATDDYLRQYTSANTYVVNGMRLDTAIMNRWKYAPVVGEPCCNSNYSQIKSQMELAHAVSVGAGNFDSGNSTMRNNIQAAGNASGHLITITGGQFKDNTLTLEWENKGNTPTYEDWTVYYELRQGSTIVKSINSFFQSPSMQLPGKWTTTVAIPAQPAGTYELHVVVKNNVRQYPLPIESKIATIKF